MLSPGMNPLDARALQQETRAVYAHADRAFARFSCPTTAECCQLAATGRPPWLYAAEWQLVLVALRAQARALPGPRPDAGCPLLDAAGKKCTVYASRPLGCRTYFCHRVQGPGRAPVEEMNALLERLSAAHLVRGDEEMPRSLIEWYEQERGFAPAEPVPDREP